MWLLLSVVLQSATHMSAVLPSAVLPSAVLHGALVHSELPHSAAVPHRSILTSLVFETAVIQCNTHQIAVI